MKIGDTVRVLTDYAERTYIFKPYKLHQGIGQIIDNDLFDPSIVVVKWNDGTIHGYDKSLLEIVESRNFELKLIHSNQKKGK